MKKIKYLIFGLLLGCLGLTSFTSAINFNTNNLPLNTWVSFTLNDTGYIVIGKNTSNILYCDYGVHTCDISIWDVDNNTRATSFIVGNDGSLNFDKTVLPSGNYEIRAKNWDYYLADFDILSLGGGNCPTCPSPTLQCDTTEKVSNAINNVILYTGTVSLNSSSFTNIFNYGNNGAGTYCIKLTSSSPQTLSFGFANGGTTAPTNLYQLYNDQYNNYVCLYGNKAYFNAKLNSSSNTVSYEVYKLTDLYNEDICINNEIVGNDCNTCESSLGSCLEDNISLENMNESLSSQLETCLLNGGNGCDPEVDTGCITGAFQVPLLSWSVGLDSFTTPIINNLVLPTNYKGKVVDGVLTISSINNNLSISDEDMASIKDSLVEVLISIFGLSLFLVLIYYIKFYMFNSK